jgi:5-methyltetrahydropteroyltriglutamate--homocysteine methyltransferase
MANGFDRFLTTHTGSLPRPDDLVRAMFAKEEGVPVDCGSARPSPRW